MGDLFFSITKDSIFLYKCDICIYECLLIIIRELAKNAHINFTVSRKRNKMKKYKLS